MNLLPFRRSNVQSARTLQTHTSSSTPFVAVAFALAAASAGCTRKQAEPSTYFDRTIAPILTTSCSRANTGAGCHVATEKGNAFGNLDTSSYDALTKRKDLLSNYGPYGQAAFLAKAVPPYQVQIEAYDGTRIATTTQIKHAAGAIFNPTADAYVTLRRWIQNGADENNSGASIAETKERSPCTTEIPPTSAVDVSVDPARDDFAFFRDQVTPVLRESCAAGNCHGVESNQLYLTCGNSPEEIRWNYQAAREYLGTKPNQSELIRRPVAPSQGGSFHEGGIIFQSMQDSGYKTLETWANAHGPYDPGAVEPNFAFFAQRVQPTLVREGCMMIQCHSSAQFHDYRLRGGSGGAFSLTTTRQNYDATLHLASLESVAPEASRIVRKNLYRPESFPGGQGIAHRGGPLFEDFGGEVASEAACARGNFDYDGGNLEDIPSYCVVTEWLRRERATRTLKPLEGIVYVRRPLDGKADRAQDFDVYRPGADLRVATATLDATGKLTVGADRSVLAGCGLNSATADVRRPAVSYDGARIAFAARGAEAEPLAIYVMGADGSDCAKDADILGSGADARVHNFDPAWSPPGSDGLPRLVFASTRGNLDDRAYDYSGPQRSPADPSKPNANLYVKEPTSGGNRIRQLTFLLDMERQPSFMLDGRVIFTTEKRAPGFYQLAGRRINLDGGDYHPLFGQRSSVSHSQMTDIVELSDKNFAGIFSDPGANHGGGTLGIVNRSIGIDFQNPDPAAYLIDSTVIDPAAPSSPEPGFFFRSLSLIDPSASGRPQQASSGVYRSPAPLPTGKLLASWGPASSLEGFNGDFDVYVVDPLTGARERLLGEAGSAEVEAVAIYGRATYGIFRSSLAEPNGHTRVRQDRVEADVLYLDVPLLASLLFQNTPTGRVVESDIRQIELYEMLPPPAGVTSVDTIPPANRFTDAFGTFFVAQRRMGAAEVKADGSARMRVPGGVPFRIKLPPTPESLQSNFPRFQREASFFYPGEDVHQGFKRQFFNGLCAACHGSVSGRTVDSAVNPDFLTQASLVEARSASPNDVGLTVDARGPVEGAPPEP